MADTGDEDVFGLEIKVDDLMGMEIADDGKELGEKTVSVFAGSEVIRIAHQKVFQSLAVNIFSQEVVISAGHIAHQMGMVETISRLKLLMKGHYIARISTEFWLQPFQEMELAVETDTVAVAGGAAEGQKFCIGIGLLDVRKG